MKHFITSLFLVFIFITFNSTIAYAEGSYSFSMTYNKISNNQIQVNVTLNNAPLKIVDLIGKLSFDQNILTLREFKSIQKGWHMDNSNTERGTFLLEIDENLIEDENSYLKAGDTLFNAIFDIKSDEKTTDVKLNEIELVNSNFESISSIPETTLNINLSKTNNTVVIIAIVIVIAIVIGVIVFFIKKKKN